MGDGEKRETRKNKTGKKIAHEGAYQDVFSHSSSARAERVYKEPPKTNFIKK